MKYLFYILFFVAWLPSFANIDVAKKAESLYQSKDYKGAIEQYESLVKQGFSSFKLYYNLGNAYYKNNQLGKAIYNYELANKLNPNNEDVKANLLVVNDKTIDKIESKENMFLGAIKSGLVNSLTTTTWAWLSITALLLTLSLFFLYYYASSIILKQITFFTSALFLIVFISTMCIGYVALNSKQNIKYAVVTVRESKVFNEPLASSNSKFMLHDGAKMLILESNNDWTNIKLQNGNEGWIKTKNIDLF